MMKDLTEKLNKPVTGCTSTSLTYQALHEHMVRTFGLVRNVTKGAFIYEAYRPGRFFRHSGPRTSEMVSFSK